MKYALFASYAALVVLAAVMLYTILKRLESADMLTVHTVEHEGRLRKYYHINPSGIRRLDEFRDDWDEIMAIYRFITKEDETYDEN